MKKQLVVFINGISYAGKDTFCDFCGEIVPTLTTSTVDRVKEIASEVFGWDGVKDEKARKLLASLRQAWGEYNDGPLYSVLDLAIKNPDKEIIFVMIREHAELIKAIGIFTYYGYSCETLWVERKDNIPGPTEQKFLDMIPEDFNYDFTIDNNGTLSALKQTAEAYVRMLRNYYE